MRRRPVPVWLMAPVGRDAALLRAGLPRGDGVRVARDARDLKRAFREPFEVGVLVLTQEALTGDVVDVLKQHLTDQEPWAELPLVLLVDPVGNTMTALARLQDALPRTKVLVLQRPIRLSELETAVDTMRRSRLRQYRVKDYVEKQDMLRRELNHRVKNILATVQALYGLTARMAPDLEAFDTVFRPRLAAMARVHEVLFAASYGEVGVREVITAVLAPYGGDDRIVLDGASFTVPAEVGQSIALMLHELATNAAKYGALTAAEGRVALSWHGGEELGLAWVETGGPQPAPPTRKGYGLTFITATVSSLGGEADFDYDEGGLRFSATMPFPS